MIKKLVVLFLATALLACAALETSEATHILNGEAYPPISEDAVVIYIQKPSFEYIVVGLVEARGMGFTNEAFVAVFLFMGQRDANKQNGNSRQ